MEIITLLALILVNGLLAMSEIALVTARRARLQAMVDSGDTAAATAITLGEHPTRFLSTIQIGITSIGVLSGIVGQATLAQPFAEWLQRLGVSPQNSSLLATALVVIVITYFSIVLGELVPKRLGQMHPERIARLVARPMQGLAALSRPFVKLLSASTDAVVKLIGIRSSDDEGIIEEEIHALLAEGSDTGVIEQQEHQMVRNVFRLDDRQITSLMIPRGDIVYLDLEDPIEQSLQKIVESHHSRFPVRRRETDELLGIITAKILLEQVIKGTRPTLTARLQPAVFVPETLTGMELLENFRASHMQMVFIVDEYGEIQGLVTLQDVLEAITGEFRPRPDEDAWATQREDGSWLLDGLIPTPELKDTLGLKSVPEEEKGRFHTLAGMLMLLLGRVPRTADSIDWEDWRFQIVDMDGKRIDKVLAARKPADTEEDVEEKRSLT